MSHKVLYAIPTMHCNLNCGHCFIKNAPEVYNREKFLDELNNFEGNIILFGGEVTSNIDRMFDVIESNRNNGKSKIVTVSTNLIVLDDKLIEFYKSLKGISTSWNYDRFISNTYDIWKKNCSIIADNGISYKVMVTLTEDLFQLSVKEFLTIAKEWITPTITEIKFEHYIGKENTSEYFNRADEWLCELYKEWDIPVRLGIINKLKQWVFDCSEVYTLYPDGRLLNCCPHAKYGMVASECYTCEKVATCRPCRLQPHCSFPNKLADLVESDKERHCHEKTN